MIEDFLQDVVVGQKRFFPEAHLVILERIPFYVKARITRNNMRFIEIRLNSRNKKQSFTLVESGKRIAGFDNLNGWHLHPFGNPDSHKKVSAP